MPNIKTVTTAFVVICAATLPVRSQDVVPTLPSGASLLQETYHDWRIGCQIVNKVKACVMSQQQLQANGQRLMGVELRTDASSLNGMLILPYGLKLNAGATLKIGQGAAMPLQFSTCLSTGCLVPLSFDAATVTALRNTTTIELTVTASDSGQQIPLPFSLDGLSPALDRLAVLSGP